MLQDVVQSLPHHCPHVPFSQPSQVPHTELVAVHKTMVEPNIPACQHDFRVHAPRQWFNHVPVCGPLKIQYVPHSDIPAAVNPVTVCRSQVPHWRAI